MSLHASSQILVSLSSNERVIKILEKSLKEHRDVLETDLGRAKIDLIKLEKRKEKLDNRKNFSWEAHEPYGVESRIIREKVEVGSLVNEIKRTIEVYSTQILEIDKYFNQ